MKDWTQWDEEAFISGVASPFIAYATETGASAMLRKIHP